ncbi:hypothetical protein DF142_31630 [Burkholderia cenocepacia]|uniref:hypothetical protein n=1 Tax=Burkholderia cenocepacia TaxID=95486 RepID=UPI000F561E2A|nr:hypothetical protein [Burkholderia cenocepacia]RQU32795.1 hypothetical protein DF142_31630 [Burkholderia cenocepacia]RQU57008.1 hypothetical protein DF140_33240 [Burkholderia cenocepacia]
MNDTAKGTIQYVIPKPDVSRADPSAAALFKKCFDGKNSHQVANFLSSFSKNMVAYSDATLGWKIPGWQALHDLLEQYMPDWGNGVSYPTRILAGATSALVAVTDTPELFGGEIHALACVDFHDGEIVRWIDYWDSASFAPEVLASMTASVIPGDLGESAVSGSAEAAIESACTRLHDALDQGARDVGNLLTYDVVYEDMTARVQLIGRSEVSGYLRRAIGLLPFGPGAEILHVVGGIAGGGYEWTGMSESNVPRGISAIELDDSGAISRITTVYDSARFGQASCQNLRDAVVG